MKRAFTLIEVVISIFLLGITVMFLYGAIDNLQKTNTIFAKNVKQMQQKEEILSLLYNDLFLADTLKLKGVDTSLIELNTTNSLYHIEHPNVAWLVSKEKNTLLRIESVLPFSTMTRENRGYYHVLRIASDCEVFKVYQSKKKDKLLINIKLKDQEPIVYEFFKPLAKRKTEPKKRDPQSQNPPSSKHEDQNQSRQP
ncbi:MAG: hypothetical protein B6D59_02920 [Campylobacteraceae bacterium 4484_4]|nr:MAG: hypothetical protein B6D59_02920 [Campylobacteraceae bacterium 4484_4]